MKHNTLTKIITLALAAVLALSLAACGSKTDDNSGDAAATTIKIGVPNDTTNEARALLLLQENGIIKLKDGVGITATKNDIVENPYNVEIVEAEAAQLPNLLPDVDYAVINSNYAINAGLNPVNDSLLIEGSASAYANILAVKEGNETAPKILALKAALESKQVADFIAERYAGSVVSVVENPYNVEIVEAEAAQLPNLLPDVDYAVINSNYAINAGLNPVNDSLLIEGSASAYANILAVKEGNETAPKILALKAALESKQVADFIAEKYAGSVVSVVENPTDGYDASVDYDALKGETISVAASPTPHAEILEVAKEILAAKDITLDIQVYNDYVVPNTVVDDGTVDANYFQHLPYLEDFNAQNGTHIVSISAVHVEPMGLYGGKQTTLDALTASAQ